MISRATPLVGRDHVLTFFDGVLSELKRGGCRFVEVVGEPGIGKTRVLREVCRLARMRRIPAWYGRAEELESDQAFGVVVDAVDDHLSASVLDELDHLDSVRCAQVLPAVADLLGLDRGGDHDTERHPVQRAMRALLAAHADPDGLLLVLDDMHWADESSVALVETLLRAAPSAPMLLVTASRPGQLPASLSIAFDAAVQDGTASHVTLDPLTVDDTQTLLADRAGDRLGVLLHEASGGNPLYLEALAHLPEPALARVTDGETIGELPPRVEAMLLRDLRQADSTTTLVAEAAALAGEPVDPQLVGAAADLDPAQVPPALRDLLSIDLLRTNPCTRQVRFRHPLLRHALYSSADPTWQAAAHARVSAQLARRGAAPELRAPHVARSARTGDEAAAGVLVAAARRLRDRSPNKAAQWLRAAMRLLPPEANHRRLELQLELADLLTVCAELTESRDLYHEVLGMLPPELADRRAETVARCAGVERKLARTTESRAMLNRELAARRDRQDEVEDIQLRLELACTEMRGLDHKAALAIAEETVTAAHERHPVLLVDAAAVASLCGLALGEVGQAFDRLDLAADCLDALSDAELLTRLDAVHRVCFAEIELERFPDALRHAERGLAVGRRSGRSRQVTDLLGAKARALTWLGQLDEAAEYTEEVLEASQLEAPEFSLQMALSLKCYQADVRGDVETAVRVGAEGLRIAEATGDLFRSHLAFWLALARRDAGEVTDPRAELSRLLGTDVTPPRYQDAAFAGERLAEASAELGSVGAARFYATFAESAADERLPGRKADALLARAHALGASGCHEDAAARAEDAVRWYDQAHEMIGVGRARLLAGAEFAAGGNRRAALKCLDKAVEVLASCGAWRLVEQAQRHRRTLGQRVSRNSPRNSTGGTLTKRETEIADLVVGGLTNRAIATRLVISERTVETHLSRVFQKLGVSSRAELVARRLGRSD
jgi:DNA-binding CsgD family transcriptional regulator/tetratricopeptide (TPR) repeat protein